MEYGFEQWMKEVDRELENLLGMGSDHFRDRGWKDNFDAGCTPIEAIEEEFGGDVNDVEAMMHEELYG